jgi:carboxylesterase
MARTSDGKDIIPGCEPWSSAGGRDGVLVLHGFTGNPQSLRGLAEAFAAAGFTVDLPLLPGHGTSVDDMLQTSWDDWSATAGQAYEALAARCDHVFVAGLSMGGTLALWLAARHPEIAGIVCVNPLIDVTDPIADFARQAIESGSDRIDSIGNDVADPAAREKAYEATPLAPLLSVHAAAAALRPELGRVTSPLLLLTSPQDHVVRPVDSDAIAAAVSGPVERVALERSFHVATLDYDKDLIEERAVAFARKLAAAE